MVAGDPDDNILSPADAKKAKEKEKKKGGKKTAAQKNVDIATLRIRAAGKLVSQLRYLQAACKESFVAVKKCLTDNQDLVTKANDLKARGVTEDRLLSDRNVNAGEGAEDVSIIKLIYSMQRRLALVILLAKGTGVTFDIEQCLVVETDAKDGKDGKEGPAESSETMTTEDLGLAQSEFIALLSHLVA